MARIRAVSKRKVSFFFVIFLSSLLSLGWSAFAAEADCPGVSEPPPVILKANLESVQSSLESLRDEQGRIVWTTTSNSKQALREIFESTPAKTKLEQFFQLLFLIQNQMPSEYGTVIVKPPGITEVLLAARVFRDSSFPKTITSVRLDRGGPDSPPVFTVQFADSEVRFPINEGKGFATWDQGMCQIAKELVFYNGFSFKIRKARNSQNLVVDRFDKVQIFGQFGTRKVVSIDLSYVDLEKVEFIKGTDQGKVTARVAKREFQENKHSAFFRFIGTLIPNTSTQRIDW